MITGEVFFLKMSSKQQYFSNDEKISSKIAIETIEIGLEKKPTRAQ